jgi:nucleotide-binding universal stress UspA family protein
VGVDRQRLRLGGEARPLPRPGGSRRAGKLPRQDPPCHRGSEEAELAASACSDLGKTTGSELHVVCVQPASYVFEMADWEAAKADFAEELERVSERLAESTLEAQAQKIRETGGEISGAHARVGFPDAEIVGLAGRLGAGLIVIGSRGRGPLRRALLGSVSDSMVRHAHCPVMVLRKEKESSA